MNKVYVLPALDRGSLQTLSRRSGFWILGKSKDTPVFKTFRCIGFRVEAPHLFLLELGVISGNLCSALIFAEKRIPCPFSAGDSSKRKRFDSLGTVHIWETENDSPKPRDIPDNSRRKKKKRKIGAYQLSDTLILVHCSSRRIRLFFCVLFFFFFGAYAKSAMFGSHTSRLEGVSKHLKTNFRVEQRSPLF